MRDIAMIVRLTRLGLDADEIRNLIRAARTLRRWFDRECGDRATVLERDKATGIPYATCYPVTGPAIRRRVPDLEKAARATLDRLRAAHPELSFYIQMDPRGPSVYVSDSWLTQTNYTNGIPIV